MKHGQKIKCPNCREDSFLLEKPKMVGWKKEGIIYVCAFCGNKIKDSSEEEPEKEASSSNENTKNTKKLEKFLGISKEKEDKLEEENKKFCRDCKYFISHPFLDRCDLHDTTVNPMDDCSDYTPK